MSLPVLSTKLYIPRPHPNLVSRPHLIDRLDEALRLGHRLLVVVAPAGYGKTTLLGEWTSRLAAATAWLSLDEADSDPVRFLTYLLAAVQTIDPQAGATAAGMLQAGPPQPEPLLTSLINDLGAEPGPVVLIVDDYHLIRALVIHQQLAFLVEHLPPRVHLVVVSREDPPLPLARLRARGQMTELRQADLQFSAAETAEFMRRTVHMEISAEDLSALLDRTEGWVAGLQLAALSLRASDDPRQLIHSLTGSQRYILDYLMEEVFQRQPPRIQSFLLKTSILDRLTAPLCDAVTGRADGRHLLSVVEQANLFLVSLDSARRWYRYHHLFADLLRQRLQTQHAGLVPDLHRRASQWYESEGLAQEAVSHALAAADWSRAARLIGSCSGDLAAHGQVVTLLTWCRAVPPETLRAEPALSLDYAWALILSGQTSAAEPYIAIAEQAAPAMGEAGRVLSGGAAAARAFVARAAGDNVRAVELSAQALALLPLDGWVARSAVAVNLGMAHWFRGRLADAAQTLVEAEQAARRSGNVYARSIALVFMNRVRLAQGRLHEAAAACRTIIEQGGRVPGVALAYGDLSRIYLEWNDLPAAAEHAWQSAELSRQAGNAEYEASSLALLALVNRSQGDAAAARKRLDESIVLLEKVDPMAGTWLHHLAVRVLVALGEGDLPAAKAAARQAPPPAEAGSFSDYVFLRLATARLLLACGERAAAAAQLAAINSLTASGGWQLASLQARALQAVTAPSIAEALPLLAEVLALAEPSGLVRTFVDAGPPMAHLLRVAVDHGVLPDYARRLLAAFEQEPAGRAEWAAADGGASAGHTLPSGSGPAAALVEPLSERELEVLHCLAKGLTNQEIALALYISVNTVKAHLQSIYGKLSVSSRRQAVAEAGRLGLLA